MIRKYIFVGNRYHVLRLMLKYGLNVVSIYSVKGSYLEKELGKRHIRYKTISAKKDLINDILHEEFDVLVSNGCPYILPVSKMKANDRLFINIHPAVLPDLRGVNPVNGAILFDRVAGATCHIMDDGIDTGAIIAQKKIPFNNSVTLPLLYKLTFLAEVEVFKKAYKRNFVPSKKKYLCDNPLYYTRKDSDMVINFHDSISDIIKRIRSFGVSSQGARFFINEKCFKVLNARVIKNNYLQSKLKKGKELQVVVVYSNNIVIKKNGQALVLENIIGDMNILKEDIILGEK